MTKKNIEIDLDLIAEKVADVIIDIMELDEKDKEVATQLNLEVLKTVSDKDFQNAIIVHYVDKTEKTFNTLGKLNKLLRGEI